MGIIHWFAKAAAEAFSILLQFPTVRGYLRERPKVDGSDTLFVVSLMSFRTSRRMSYGTELGGVDFGSGRRQAKDSAVP